MPTDFSALFSPRSLAIVGASENATRIGGRPMRYLREAGFKGAVYPVNPKRDVVQGYKCYPSIAALPETPDLALLAVPAKATIDAVRACAERGVKIAIIFSAGFAEADEEGKAAEDEMVAIARAAGMRLLGPNCLGVFNSSAKFYGTFSVILDEAFIEPGPVAIVSQSGAYGATLADLARKRGLGISQWLTSGNECDIDMAEALKYVVQQPETRVVMAYAESVRNRESFIEALDAARNLGKAVVFMKTGRSSVGAKAAASHTAALAGSDAVFDAVLRQYGAYRARTTAEQLDIAYAASFGVYPKGNQIGIFTFSGGFGIQMADDSEDAGLDVTPMPDSVQADLKALLPYASPQNPVDATAQAVTDLPLMTEYMRAMIERGGYDIFTAILGTGPASRTFGPRLVEALDAATAGHDDIVKGLTMSVPREIAKTFEERGFLVYEDGSALVNAIGALNKFRESFELAGKRRPVELMNKIQIPSDALSERGAKRLLLQAGIDFPVEELVAPGEDAGLAASRVGFPVVLKISSPDIAHKTEIGGVVVGVRSEEEARQATADIFKRAAEKAPDAKIEGVVISPMIGPGVETIIGVSRDPVLGPIVMFGLGGVFVEVLKDVTFRAAPFGIEEAHRMIREIRGYSMLEGVRGAEASDVDALAELLSNLSRFAAAHAEEIEGIDLNPVRVMPKGQGVKPLDALIIPRRREPT